MSVVYWMHCIIQILLNRPMRLAISYKPLSLLLAAVFVASSVWLFAQRMVRHQIANEMAQNRPRGNLSDLYPRWLGARELLLRGRDPYGVSVTREIQQGFYGRPLDPAQPADPKDQEGFVYPVYIVFFLAPTIHLPFQVVQKGAFWVLLGLTIAIVPFWLRVMRWRLQWWAGTIAVILTIGSLPVMQGLKLQQMTLLVLTLVVAAMALVVSGHPVPAGVLLAFSTIKPQLVWLLLFWLILWTLADFRRRYRWVASFLLTMTVLVAGSEWYLPHWIPRFLQAVQEYRAYTEATSMLDKMVPAPWGWLLAMLTIVATVQRCWQNRKFAQDTPEFAATTSLVLAVTVVVTVASNYALYNQVLLLPAVLLVIRKRHEIWAKNRSSRVMLSLSAIFLIWPWLTNIVLAGLSYILPLEVIDRAWPVPFWTVLPLPVTVAGTVLLMSYQNAFTAPPKPGTS
jgi:hypothetical protein